MTLAGAAKTAFGSEKGSLRSPASGVVPIPNQRGGVGRDDRKREVALNLNGRLP